MRLSLGHSQILRCILCDQDVREHELGCLWGQKEAASKKRLTYQCPDCLEYRIERNRDDYFECENCASVFSSRLCDDPEPVWIVNPLSDGWPIKAVRLPSKGDGDFPLLVAISEIAKSIDRHPKMIAWRKKMGDEDFSTEPLSNNKDDGMMEEKEER